jgi:hypothetical protein
MAVGEALRQTGGFPVSADTLTGTDAPAGTDAGPA